jgi:DNA invertase Pin-like site-specific DNA recombinase
VYKSSHSSCDAQRHICTDAVASFIGKIIDIFADQGHSSETLMRPEMQRLMSGIELGQFDRVVVYSIDRLTCRLFELARLAEIFD